MKKTSFKKLLSVLLCLALVVAIALIAAGCKGSEKTKPSSEKSGNAQVATTGAAAEEITKVGEGEKEFTFIAKDADGKETKFLVKSNAATVGAALLDAGLIAGDPSEYGLYVKTVNGITLNYDTDKMYWAFYVGDTYASTGVDSTELVAGTTYSFVATKG